MARRGRDRRTARRDDRLSALSDDLLLDVLRRLDTRTALAAGSLSRRWAHLPLELPALDFRISDILSPRYHRCILLHRREIQGTILDCNFRGSEADIKPKIRRYERRAMRSLTSSVESFLDAAKTKRDRPRRRLSKLRLEFFATYNTSSMNRLIAEAIDTWGLDHLEALAKPTFQQRQVHTFPSCGLCKEPRASRLQNLKLGGCMLPPLHEYSALTVLVLQDIPDSPAAAYEGVFSSCPQLQTLHLIN